MPIFRSTITVYCKTIWLNRLQNICDGFHCFGSKYNCNFILICVTRLGSRKLKIKPEKNVHVLWTKKQNLNYHCIFMEFLSVCLSVCQTDIFSVFNISPTLDTLITHLTLKQIHDNLVLHNAARILSL